MRCTRCDQPILIHALGRNPHGVLVFGWCVSCLNEELCRDIEPAVRLKRPKSRLVLTERAAAPDANAKLLRGIASGVATWGLILFAAGLLRLFRSPDLASSSPLGNGTSSMFVIGGASLGLLSLGIRASTWSRREQLRVRKFITASASGGASIGLWFLGLWSLRERPWATRLPFLILAAIFATLSGLSATAKQREIRRVNAPSQARRQPQSPNL